MSAITQAYEDAAKSIKPIALRSCGTESIVGRDVLAWSPYQGTYGMGGPGFFELTLSERKDRKQENLVLCLWAASEWLLLNGKWMECHPAYYELQKPLFSNFHGQQWDLVTDLLKGSRLEQFDLDDKTCRIEFSNGAVIELPEDKSLLPLHGNKSARLLAPSDSLRDAWVLTGKQVLWI